MEPGVTADRYRYIAGLGERIRSILDAKPSGVWSVGPDASVYDAIALMAEKSVGALPVIEDRKLVGIISERDYARKVVLQGRSSKDTHVREIMTSTVITITPDQTVDDCMRIVTEHHIRHLPVVDQNEVTGMISIGDLVSVIISAQANTIRDLSRYITSDYPV